LVVVAQGQHPLRLLLVEAILFLFRQLPQVVVVARPTETMLEMVVQAVVAQRR
jgi:hypothetical protein